ncbi:MAG: hypothetical protein KJN66_04675 [Bacteroidia bacterium]|nr:hypothetical protein [Bacteroidia bacterium]
MKSITDGISLGLREILAVLVPGLVMLCLIWSVWREQLKKIDWDVVLESSWDEGIILFIASYFVGYIIYVYSSFLDSWYDKIKRKALELDKGENSDKKLQIIKPEDFKIKNILLRFLFPHIHDTHNLIVKVVAFKNRDIGDDLDGEKHQAINAYQYAYRRLMAENEAMFTETESYFGTAKFFRSMTIVLFIGAIIWLIFQKIKFIGLMMLVGCIVAFFIFLNRWRKANHVAFKSIIILEAINNRS